MEKERFFERFHLNERAIFLSDGVFAIVLTLLILELRVPAIPEDASWQILLHELVKLKSKFLSFVLSFVFISSLWFSHNQFFKLLIKIDNVILWINNFFLLFICFIPFPTALIGEYPHNSTGMFLFGISWVFIPMFFYAMGSYAHKHKMLTEHIDINRFLEIRKTTLLFIPASLVPLSVSLFYPQVSFAIYIVMLVFGIALGAKVKLTE